MFVDLLLITGIIILTVFIHKSMWDGPAPQAKSFSVGFSNLNMIYNQEREEYDLLVKFHNRSETPSELLEARLLFKHKVTGMTIYIEKTAEDNVDCYTRAKVPFKEMEMEDLELVREEYVLVDDIGNAIKIERP